MTDFEKGYSQGYADAVSDRPQPRRLPHGWVAFIAFVALCGVVWYITGVTP